MKNFTLYIDQQQILYVEPFAESILVNDEVHQIGWQPSNIQFDFFTNTLTYKYDWFKEDMRVFVDLSDSYEQFLAGRGMFLFKLETDYGSLEMVSMKLENKNVVINSPKEKWQNEFLLDILDLPHLFMVRNHIEIYTRKQCYYPSNNPF